MQRHRSQRGFTVLELTVVLTVCAVAWAVAQPRYGSVVERARRDEARQRLTSVWRAQRVYWVRHATFASSTDDLVNERLLEPSSVRGDRSFSYEIAGADPWSFQARAVRQGSDVYEGHLEIDQAGSLVDQIEPPL